MDARVPIESGEDPDPRIRLALSMIDHRRFCAGCTATIDEIRLALLGASLEEITQRHAS